MYGRVILLFVSLVIFSCKKKDAIETKKHTQERIKYKVQFPDTVIVNKPYNGVIKYQSSLDTVTTTFDDKKKNRYVLFFMTITQNPNYDEKHLKQIFSDTFGASNNREIDIENIQFNKPGIFYIDGIINDYVVIDLDKKNKEGTKIVREIEDEKRVTHKVVVIGKSQ
ncbi:hypothetical protein [Flavobacterium sp.]|uniref:hypothetical protein n=1 Tax=Flavobacterium sp. TaxID=239 RepID=UPI00391DC6F2